MNFFQDNFDVRRQVRAFRYAQLEYRYHIRQLIPTTGGTVLAQTIPDMYGVLRHTGLGALSFFLGYILECRISAMPKIFLIVWFKIDYERYLLTNKNQENREEKKECVSFFLSFHICFSISCLSLYSAMFVSRCTVCQRSRYRLPYGTQLSTVPVLVV